MSKSAAKVTRKPTGPAVLLTSAVGLLALPSAVLGLSSHYQAPQEQGVAAIDTIVPGEVDPRLARSISVRTLASSDMFHFTPAIVPARPAREVTVAVLSSGVAHSILVKTAPGPGGSPASPAADAQQIAPVAYNLGVARGYRGFAPSGSSAAPIAQIDMPDLASFNARNRNQADGGRFSPRIELDERASNGRAPRTFSGEGEQTVDVGGAYRVGRNLDVTAGVRYSQERDRLHPVEQRRQDGQSVYVGTQFRF